MKPTAGKPGRATPVPPAGGRAGAVLLLCFLLALLILAPALRDLTSRGGWNWASFRGSMQAEVTTLLRHGQLPLWNPWRAGGMVGYAEPQSMFLTPITPLAALVGVMPALKIACVLAVALGAFGMWLLAGRLGLSGAARLLPPVLVFGSSVPMQYVVYGPLPWLYGLALLPWLLLAFECALDDNRHVLSAALCWAGMLCFGDTYHFIYAPLLLGLWAAVRALQRRSALPLLLAAAAGLVGVCIVSVRLAPLFDVYAQFPRESATDARFVTPSLLLRLLVDPFLPSGTYASTIVTVSGVSVELYDCFAYVGALALAAALLGLLAPRRALAPLAVVLLFAWIACGPSVWPNLWGLLSKLPVFRSMRLPERHSLYVLFGLSLLAGFGIERLGRWRSAAAALVAAGCVVPMLFVGWPMLATAFTPAPPAPPPPGAFRQEAFVAAASGEWGVDDQQAAVLMNLGNLTANHDVPTPRRVQPAGSPLYRGEVYLRHGHGRVEADITPNVVHVRADLDAPDTLVINQNWFPGWEARGSVAGPLHEDDGLPALSLPTGRSELDLRFSQPSLAKGAAITLATLLIAALYLLAARRSVARDRFRARDAAALAALLILAAIQGVPRASRPAAAAPPEPRRLVAAAEADLQALADSLRPGDVLALPAGTWPGLRLCAGLALEGPAEGLAIFTAPLAIEGVPHGERVAVLGGVRAPGLVVRDCAGTVVLQDLLLGAGGLLVAGCERVHLLGGDCEGEARIERSVLTSSGTALRGGTQAERAWLLLSGGSTGPLDLQSSMLLAEDVSWERLQLHDGSRARLAGDTPAVDDVDATSRVERMAHRPPRVTQVKATAAGLRVRLVGEPGRTALLIVGDDSALQAWGRDDNFYLVDMVGELQTRAVTLPADGVLDVLLPRRAPAAGVASWFAQTGSERTPGRLDLDLSLLNGVLLPAALPPGH